MQELNGEKKNGLMLVGIGASAGGIDAMMRLFEKMPANSGLAFAVLLHTTPNHDNRLAEVLQRATAIPVQQVTDDVRVEPNRVYCLPPDRPVSLSGGQIRLVEPDLTENGHGAPIDLFFRALAHSYRDKAIAVVLSGAGADGSLGLGRLREEGGVSIAQDPSEAEHETMPRSAIETGWVDFILPVAAIPDKLVSLRDNAERIQLPPAETPPRTYEEDALRELLALLRARTRHDFSNYKRTTLLRRIERRLQVTESEDLREYLEYIRKSPEELQGLLRDLLISVTNFFRDPEAFRRLEADVIPKLFRGKGSGDQIRVWVTGCATGEEAYSIAMMLAEHADTIPSPPTLQVFATDIDEEALAQGRNGLYPHTIAADVNPERLKRFFSKEGQYYRVRRDLREMVLFAPHNILRDPPFSKLILVSCRNLLIYINRNMQERILEIFHFALKPEGFLFLGSSESAEGLSDLFTPINKKHRIFKRGEDGTPAFKSVPPPPMAGEWVVRPTPLPPMQQLGTRAEGITYGELHYRMLESLAPPSVLVNADYDIVHLSEHAGRYLRLSGGEPTRNLLNVAHPDLRLELRSLLISAAQQGEVMSGRAVVNLEGTPHFVRVVVRPLASPQVQQSSSPPAFMLVIFEEADALLPDDGKVEEAEGAAEASSSALEPIVRQLETELERTRDQLRATVEEYGTSTEELKASNEELQAMNEELRSASEELETGKEELQSVNEELTTLNTELREKVDEIGRSNSDLQNLMASTRIATLFLDRTLRLKRYTPSAQELFNVIPGDVGRPLAHITHKLEYRSMVEDAERVLRDLQTTEREVTSTDGRHLLARLLPYRATDDKINGVVLTFTDVTERRHVEEALRESESRMQSIANLVPDLLWESEPDGSNNWYNRRWMEYTGQTLEQSVGWGWADAIHPEERETSVRRYREAVEQGEPLRQEYRIRHHDGEYRWFVINALPQKDEGGRVLKMYSAASDIHEQRAAHEALRVSEERMRLVLDTAEDYAIILMDSEGRYTSWNRGAEKMFGYKEEEVLGQHTALIFTPEDREAGVPQQEIRTADRDGRATDERWHMRKDGSRFYVSGVMVSLRLGRGYAKIARDLTAQKRSQDDLHDAWEGLEKHVETRTAELASTNSALQAEVGRRRRSEHDRVGLLRRIVNTQEDERRRISRELHDQLGQSLTALRLKLEGLKNEAGRRSKLQSRIEELMEMAERLDADVDFLAWELRPTALDDLGLIVALSNFAQEWSKHFNVNVNFHSAGLGEARLAPLVETSLYRIAQEALNNVSKHAGATSVDMLLERRDHHAVLIVEDNGRGFDPEEVKANESGRGMGLIGMRERAALVGGSVEVESRQGGGTTVFARVPTKFPPAEGLEDEE